MESSRKDNTVEETFGEEKERKQEPRRQLTRKKATTFTLAPHLANEANNTPNVDNTNTLKSSSKNSTTAITKSLKFNLPLMKTSSEKLPTSPPFSDASSHSSCSSRSSGSSNSSRSSNSYRYSSSSISSRSDTPHSSTENLDLIRAVREKVPYSHTEIIKNYTSDHKLLEILIKQNHLSYILSETKEKSPGIHTVNLDVKEKKYNLQPMSNQALKEGIIEIESVIEYELTVMPTLLKPMKKQMIEFRCNEEKSGLDYRLISLNGMEVYDFVPWSELGNDFPQSNDQILEQEEVFLPIILQHTSKHTRINKDGKKEGLHYRIMVDGVEVYDSIPWPKLPAEFPIDENAIIKDKEKWLSEILCSTAEKGQTPLYSVDVLVPEKSAEDNSSRCYILNSSQQIGGTIGAGGKVIFGYEISKAVNEKLTDIDKILNDSAVVKIMSGMSIDASNDLMATTESWGQYLGYHYEKEEKILFLLQKPIIYGCNYLDLINVRDYTKNKDSKRHFAWRRYIEPDIMIDLFIQSLTLVGAFYKTTNKLHTDIKNENLVINSSYLLTLIDLDTSKTPENIILIAENKNRIKDTDSHKSSPKPNPKQLDAKRLRRLSKRPPNYKTLTYFGSPGYSLLEGTYGKKNEIFAAGMSGAESFSFLLYQVLLRALIKDKEYADDITYDECRNMLYDIFNQPFLTDEFRENKIENTWDTVDPTVLYKQFLAKRLTHIYPADLEKLQSNDQEITNLIIALLYIYPRIITEVIEVITDKAPEKRTKAFDNIHEFVSILEQCKKDYKKLFKPEGLIKYKNSMKKYYRTDGPDEQNDMIRRFRSSFH